MTATVVRCAAPPASVNDTFTRSFTREELGPICFVADPDGYRVELIAVEEFPAPQD